MIANFCNMLKIFLQTYVATGEGLATLLVVFVMLLKLFINRKATAIHYKKTIISIPSEIFSLVVGFLISSMLKTSIPSEKEFLFTIFIIVLIVLVFQYAAERELNDKLSGKLKFSIILWILVMFIVSIVLYIIIVFGGLI